MTEQTQPTDALLPCPFCGAAAHFEMDEGRWEWVECESCGMQGNRSASLMDDCKPKLAEEWNRRTPPAVAPWRSAVLDLIDDCPGLTLEQDHWLSRRVKELDFATTPQPTQAQAGAVVITTDPDTGQCVAVTRQDDEGRVLSVIWQAPEAQAGAVPLTVQYPEGYGNPLAKIAYDAGWRAAEHAHGIKGADHA